MRTREVTTQWNHMVEGDKFLRYEKCGAVKMLVVQRTEPDLPTDVGSMGYATITIRGESKPGMLVIKTREDGALPSWMAPLVNDSAHRWLREGQISAFEEVRTASMVEVDTVLKTVVDASSQSHQQLEFVGVDVNAVAYAVMDLFYQGD